VVRDYLAAFKSTIEYIRGNAELSSAFADTLGIESDAERALLQQSLERSVLNQWDDEQIALQQRYLQQVHDVIGERVLPAVPADLIRDEYAP
jgi:hypothetical protein